MELRLPIQLRSHDQCFWDAEGVILVYIMSCQTINSHLYIQTLKTLHQLAKRVKPHKNVTEILQQDNALSHTTLKTQEAITKLGQLFVPTHHTAQTLYPWISTSLKPPKMPSVAKGQG